MSGAGTAFGIAVLVACAPAVSIQPVDERLQSADGAMRASAIAEVLAHPERVDPFSYAALITALWRDGRRQQAAFWFYVFQVRTRPWADADRGGDGAAALRAALNDGLGTTINGWLGSDLSAWRTIAERAMAYEARFPLYARQPTGVRAADWPAIVAKARAEYRAGYDQTLATADPAAFAAERRRNGLPVGPLAAPGPALPDGWR